MSAGWEVGDLALCLDGGRWSETDGQLSVERDPQGGEVYLVIALDWSDGFLALWLEGVGSDSYEASEFRKIRPDAHEDCEPEFVTLLNRIKRPAKQGEPA